MDSQGKQIEALNVQISNGHVLTLELYMVGDKGQFEKEKENIIFKTGGTTIFFIAKGNSENL